MPGRNLLVQHLVLHKMKELIFTNDTNFECGQSIRSQSQENCKVGFSEPKVES